MKLNNTVIDIIHKIITNQTLSTLTPLKLKFFNGSTDITLDLFGFASYSVTTDRWNAAANKEITNALAMSVGTLLISFSGDLTLKFFTTTDLEILSYTYNTSIAAGSSYSIIANALKISLPNLTTNLAHFLLNYLFRNVTTGKPTLWYLELEDSTNVAYGSRILLDCDKFSHLYTNEIGHRCVSYGKYLLINTATTKEIKSAKLYTGSTGGTSWFDISNLLPVDVYSGRTLEVYNNTLVISIPPTDLATNFVLPEDDTCIFYASLDGVATDLAIDKEPIFNSISYNPQTKLFNAESGNFNAGERLEYDFNFPLDFGFEFFVNFSTSPVGRSIMLLEKPGSILFYKTSTDYLQVENQSGVILSAPWNAVANTWYHIFMYKASYGGGGEFRVFINSMFDVYVGIGAGNLFAINSNPLSISSTLYPVLGQMSNISAASVIKTYVPFVPSPPKRAYDWKYINSHIWKDMAIEQWYQYF